MAAARLHVWIEAVPALDRARLAVELAEAGCAPDLGLDAPILRQEIRRGENLAQDRARPDEPDWGLSLALYRLNLVHPLNNGVLHALRHGRLGVVLVHDSNVVEAVLLPFHHVSHAVVHNDREFVGESGIVGLAVRDRRGDDVA